MAHRSISSKRTIAAASHRTSRRKSIPPPGGNRPAPNSRGTISRPTRKTPSAGSVPIMMTARRRCSSMTCPRPIISPWARGIGRIAFASTSGFSRGCSGRERLATWAWRSGSGSSRRATIRCFCRRCITSPSSRARRGRGSSSISAPIRAGCCRRRLFSTKAPGASPIPTRRSRPTTAPWPTPIMAPAPDLTWASRGPTPCGSIAIWTR